LAAFEVSKKDMPEFKGHLDKLAYVYQEETDNPCYQRFLAAGDKV
jgi:threonine dehydratase